MLSPGKYHERVPRGRGDNLRFRAFVLRRCREEPAFRAAVVEACRRDILFFVNTFVWQHNPRKKGGGEVGPFVCWPFQEAAVRAILRHVEEDADLLIEKSREMGASWLCLIVMDWLCLFHGWQKFLTISHSEAAVDRPDDPDSLFWKVEFMHQHLPDWLARGAKKRKLGFAYPATRSSLNGAATTGRSGVGGRATAVFLDEFSKHTEDYEILGQTADTTGCRIFNGTHYGLGTAFYDLTRRPDMKRLVMHWSQHPDKNRGLYRWDAERQRVEVLDKRYAYPPDFKFVTDGTPSGGPFPGLRSPWYDAECRRRASARDVAMHLDIDPKGSVSQFFDALTVNMLKQQYACDPYWRGDLHHEGDSGRPVALVPVPAGPLKLWLTPTPDGKVPASRYAAGADIAAGTGATPSCLSVIDGPTGAKVLEYTNPHLTPDEFAALCVAACRLFADADGEGAVFAWEAAGPGLKFGQKVIEMGYRNVYYRTDEFNLEQKVSDRPGWYPAPNNKRVLLEDYRAALTGRKVTNRSAEALDECLAFAYGPRGDVAHAGEESANDPTGARVNHGDRVIADALAWKMAKDIPKAARLLADAAPPPGSLAWRRQLRERATQDREAWA